MEKFLKQVADYYIDKSRKGLDLADCVFVFPNRRSALFFSKYIKQGYGSVGMLPRLTTITSFTQQFCPLTLASPTEQLFVLYNAYLSVLAKLGRSDQARDFDSFAYWGTVLLEDFNDVDASMADAHQLFKNVKDEKEIEANYLTDEQIEVARILGDKRPRSNDPEHFWKHVAEGAKPDNAAAKFVNLWEMLGDLYDEFRNRLQERGLAYSGMQARMVAEKMKDMTREDFEGIEKVVFVGFYVLGQARTRIFARLQELGLADFFWDVNLEILYTPGSKAGAMIKPLSQAFEMPADFNLQTVRLADMPQFEIRPVASNAAQTKVAAAVMQEWLKADKESGPDSLPGKIPNHAWGVVMPNDKLLTPMLSSLPDDVGDFNVAMRLPFSDTPFASLINAVLRMHDKARIRRGAVTYYYKDVVGILSQPYIAAIAPEAAGDMRKWIKKNIIYNVDGAEAAEKFPALAFVFRPVADVSDKTQVKDYLASLFGTLRDALYVEPSQENPKAKKAYEIAILDSYLGAIDEMFTLAGTHGIDMKQHTFFTLIRRLLGVRNLQLDGNPVRGLQLLGVQEARVLDFDSLVIMSLNERILPKKTFSPSLIPALLRDAYGLPTLEDEESNLEYQFYRLIARASRLCLIYDSRMVDKSMGEMSRYVRQLQLLLPDKAVVREVTMNASPGDSRTITIAKDDEVMAELQAYMTPGGKNISASTLKTYITCPLKFYLMEVKGLKLESFDPEYIDAASYGSVLHEVAEKLYNRSKGQIFDKEKYALLLQDPPLTQELTNMALESMNKLYYNKAYEGRLNEIPGEGRVLAKIIAKYIKNMLIKERDAGQMFVFKEAEFKNRPDHPVWNVGGREFNFSMSIDRIDSLDDGKKLRFIDYKTGNDSLEAASVEDLFGKKDCGAIFQLMLYCIAYADIYGYEGDIMPVVYKFTKMASDGMPPLKVASNPLLNYKDIEEEFRDRLDSMLDEIFSPEGEFAQTQCHDNCQYCPFAAICGRNAEPKDKK